MQRSTAKHWAKLQKFRNKEGGAILGAKGTRPRQENPQKQLNQVNESSLTQDRQLGILHNTKLGCQNVAVTGSLYIICSLETNFRLTKIILLGTFGSYFLSFPFLFIH